MPWFCYSLPPSLHIAACSRSAKGGKGGERELEQIQDLSSSIHTKKSTTHEKRESTKSVFFCVLCAPIDRWEGNIPPFGSLSPSPSLSGRW